MAGKSTYKPEYADQLIAFFNVEPFTRETVAGKNGEEKVELVPTKFPTIARFATTIGVTRQTLHKWATATKDDKPVNPEFAEAYEMAKDYQEAILVEGGMAGAFNPSFAIFTAKNVLGWRDKQEITGKDGGAIETKDVSMLEAARRMVFLLNAAGNELERSNG